MDKLKCVGSKCREFSNSDYLGYCNIARKYILDDEYCAIDDVIEDKNEELNHAEIVKYNVIANQKNNA